MALALGLFLALTSLPAEGYQLRSKREVVVESDLDAEESQLEVTEDDLGTAESQQVSAVATHDLVAAAGKHGKMQY